MTNDKSKRKGIGVEREPDCFEKQANLK